MLIKPAMVGVSPFGSSRVRISAEVEYATSQLPRETYWFDFPAEYRDQLSLSGSPWLTLLLPLACQLGEELHLASPVDATLLEGACENMRVWARWHKDMQPISIIASLEPLPEIVQRRRVGTFFSGGADSFFTLLQHEDPPNPMPRVDDLVTIWGFDIPIDRPEEVEHARASIAEVARIYGKGFIDIWTNLRLTQSENVSWGERLHGPAMIAVAQFLESRFSRVLIPSSYSYSNLSPWGSHIVTDQNFSTSATRFTYDGGGFTRNQKIAAIRHHAPALAYLRVCWIGATARNCMKCGKCVRTMLALEAFGVRSQCSAFDYDAFSLDFLRSYKLDEEYEYDTFADIYAQIDKDAQRPLAEALAECLRLNRSRFDRIARLKQLEMMPLVGWLFGWYKRQFITGR